MRDQSARRTPEVLKRRLVVIPLVGLALAGCGTRVTPDAMPALESRSEAVATAVTDRSVVEEQAGPADTAGTGAAPAESAAGASAPTGRAGARPAGSTAVGSPPVGAGPTNPSSHRSSGSGTSAPASGTASGGTAPGVPGAPTPADQPADTSPIVIASVGTMSGPAGSVIRRVAEGVQVWVAATNAKGGIAGHPIKHIMADDGADPARHKAELRRVVEQDKVVALVGNPDAGTGQAGVDYLREQRVPSIGGDGGGDWYYSTPFHFPQGPMGVTLAVAEIRDVGLYGKAHSKKKLGTLACTEADICRVLDRVWNEKAQSYGLEPVYRGQATLVQPDFTAECLAARREGVELFEIALDTNSIGRLASSCARQGFKPIYGFPAGITKSNQQDDPNLEGARSTLPTFSWLQNNSPATAEFQEAMKRFGQSLQPLTGGHTGGWTAGKLFEKGVLAGGVTGKVSRQSVLAGLYTIKNDTLGGLTGPLTFAADNTAARTTCTSGVEIVQGKWRPINDGAFNCQ